MAGNLTVSTELQEYLRPGKRTWVIFWVSVVGLFLEMLFIRWIGTEVRIFAYLQNTILISCFLGIGLGCFTCQKEINLRQSLIPLVILVTLLAVPITRKVLGNISEMLSVVSDFVIWGMAQTTNQAEMWLMVVFGLFLTYVIVMLVVDIFVPIGRLLGRSMDAHPNTIWAYSVNLAGSLVGTLLFVLMSFLQLPPFAWFIVFGLMMLVFAAWDRKNRKVILALVAVTVAVSPLTGLIPDAKEVIWSPYQKLVLIPAEKLQPKERGLAISVNNIGYQGMNDLRESSIDADPAFYPPEMKGFSQYDMPLLLHADPQSFLIVGAGSGNDAAGGVRHGVKDITAVDIDPVIIDIGRRYHPELPYSSPNVHVVNDDARSFFATTQKKYDVISFGLLDSHTSMVMTNTRLDHYIYTRESIERAKALLNDGGVMTLTFQIQRPYIGDRIFSVLSEVFGYDPMVFYIPSSAYGWGGTVFVTGDLQAVQQQLNNDPKLASFITKMQQEYPFSFSKDEIIATDDWPYLYQEKPGIPKLFFFLAVLMAVVLVRSAWRWQAMNLAVRWHRSHWHFFFLGAAFLLLEVQNVSKAAVVLGNTWQVNAVIVSSVLAMALVANYLAHRFPGIKAKFAYVCLFTITIALYFIDISQFAFLPFALKALIVGGLTTLPMLFSGIIFVRSFASAEGKDEALGANMIGSLAGALLQSVTFLIGIKALLLVVFVLYALSAVMMIKPAKAFVRSENPAT